LPEGSINNRNNILHMGAAGQFRNYAAILLMDLLRSDNIRQDLSISTN